MKKEIKECYEIKRINTVEIETNEKETRDRQANNSGFEILMEEGLDLR